MKRIETPISPLWSQNVENPAYLSALACATGMQGYAYQEGDRAVAGGMPGDLDGGIIGIQRGAWMIAQASYRSSQTGALILVTSFTHS